ncbi:unnamed protein product [Acanthosepion pharaonis]|uniref:Uncharacterized protein n=1 Tax=Acanthosepion pharaonis TaxID=158019 RepID=A0A812AQ48_ACAPH|nr:unnamed protein product [Sepia pharaonis]
MQMPEPEGMETQRCGKRLDIMMRKDQWNSLHVEYAIPSLFSPHYFPNSNPVYTSLPLLINNPFSFFHCLFPSFSLHLPRILLFSVYFFSPISHLRFTRFFFSDFSLPLSFALSLSHSLLQFAFSLLPFAFSFLPFAFFFHLFICFFLSSIHFLSPYIVCFLLPSPFHLLPPFLFSYAFSFSSFLCIVPLSLPPSIYFLPPSFPLFFLPSFRLLYPSLHPITFSLSPFSFFLPTSPFHLPSLTFHLQSCFLFYYLRYFHFFVSLYLFT